MEINLTVSYIKENDTVEIMLKSDSNNTTHPNKLIIPRDFYKHFISILFMTGQKMQKDSIDVGFGMEVNEND